MSAEEKELLEEVNKEKEESKEEDGGNILDDILNTKEEKFEDEETAKKEEDEDDDNDLDLGSGNSGESSSPREEGGRKGPESDFSDSEDEETKAILRDGRDSEMSFKVGANRNIYQSRPCRRSPRLDQALNQEMKTRRGASSRKVRTGKVMMRRTEERRE